MTEENQRQQDERSRLASIVVTGDVEVVYKPRMPLPEYVRKNPRIGSFSTTDEIYGLRTTLEIKYQK